MAPLPWAIYGALVGLAVGGLVSIGLAGMAGSGWAPPPPDGARSLEWPIALLVATSLFGASGAGGAMSYNFAARLVRGLRIDVELRDGEAGPTRASLRAVSTRRAARTLILGSLIFGLAFGLVFILVTASFATEADRKEFALVWVAPLALVALSVVQAIAFGWLGAWTYNRWCRRHEAVWLAVRSRGRTEVEIRVIPPRPLTSVALRIGAIGGPVLAQMVLPLQAAWLLRVAPPADLPPPPILIAFFIFAGGLFALFFALALGFEAMVAAAILSRIYNHAVRWLPAIRVEIADDDPP